MDSSSQIFIGILIDQRARMEDMYNYGNVACASVVFISCILQHTASREYYTRSITSPCLSAKGLYEAAGWHRGGSSSSWMWQDVQAWMTGRPRLLCIAVFPRDNRAVTFLVRLIPALRNRQLDRSRIKLTVLSCVCEQRKKQKALASAFVLVNLYLTRIQQYSHQIQTFIISPNTSFNVLKVK